MIKDIFKDMFDNCINFGVGGFIYNPNTYSVLLGKRSKSEDYNNYWCIFGGKVDDDENLKTSLSRELKEEANINTNILNISNKPIFFDVVSDNFIFFTYLCLANKNFDVKLNDEHTDYDWFNVLSLPYPLHPGVINFLNDKNVINILSTCDILKNKYV